MLIILSYLMEKCTILCVTLHVLTFVGMLVRVREFCFNRCKCEVQFQSIGDVPVDHMRISLLETTCEWCVCVCVSMPRPPCQ